MRVPTLLILSTIKGFSGTDITGEVVGLDADLSDLIHLKGVMVGLVGRDHGSVGSQGVVDPGVGN